MVRLQRGMGDPEAIMQHSLNSDAYFVAIDFRADQKMA